MGLVFMIDTYHIFKGYKVALAQEEQIISALDWEPENFDVKLDQIIYRG